MTTINIHNSNKKHSDCMFERLSPKCKQENEIYYQQMRKLALFFSSIESTEIREDFIKLIEKLPLENEKELKRNLSYINEFAGYMVKIIGNGSAALKDKIMEMVKTFAKF